jgi:predicted dinucleotide-binding enzyme
MKVSLMGTGRMGVGLAGILSRVIPDLQWGSRDLKKVQRLILENEYLLAQPVTYEMALEADVIFHTLWLQDLIPWAKEHATQLRDKILVDIVNPFTPDFNDFTLNWGTSAAEELQKLLPDTKVVGAFKNTFYKVFEQPFNQGLISDVYVTSDDEDAKKNVMELLKGIPFRVLDGGQLINNRTIERMTLFERELALRYGNYPYVSFHLFGINAGEIEGGDKINEQHAT